MSDPTIFQESAFNSFMDAGRKEWSAVRARLTELLSADNATIRDDVELRSEVLVSMEDATMQLPVKIGDYTDFYSSKEHATNLGKMFRPNEEPLQPNWVHLPVGYHGRASSIMVSGTPLRRPNGQTKKPDEDPTFTTCKLLDIELETGFFVGPGNDLGDPIRLTDAENHIFGMVLLNDWSARDIQKWEYVPLGPFNGKNLGSTISPWIVTLEALEPFRVAQPEQDPEPLKYLSKGKGEDAFDVKLSVGLKTAKMAEEGEDYEVVSTSNFKYMYWSMKQQLTHHSVTGCNMRPGDFLGSGTLSGPNEGELGSFLEMSKAGKEPLTLKNGEERKLLADGDSVMLRGYAQGDGFRVGFGECEGTILPPIKYFDDEE
eukprot:TRINITY_DN5251_c1_g1_i5.p1 TRINITY_DN5251_c1_g1~~TRINITY_DN5251_c1_g1_i5.p1  ORF type:complete len:373 (+),score=145.94 TRINITY_DN5251_c1_g1_i5:1075-2193(+)